MDNINLFSVEKHTEGNTGAERQVLKLCWSLLDVMFIVHVYEHYSRKPTENFRRKKCPPSVYTVSRHRFFFILSFFVFCLIISKDIVQPIEESTVRVAKKAGERVFV